MNTNSYKQYKKRISKYQNSLCPAIKLISLQVMSISNGCYQMQKNSPLKIGENAK